MENSIATLCLWSQGNSRTRTVDKDNLFARLLQSLQEIALNLRQFDVGAVTTLEARNLDRHFLTFQLWRDATYEDYCLAILQLLERSLIVDRILMTDIDLHIGIIGWHLSISYFYLILLAFHALKLDAGFCCAPITLF